jgi:hypothetical protein
MGLKESFILRSKNTDLGYLRMLRRIFGYEK